MLRTSTIAGLLRFLGRRAKGPVEGARAAHRRMLGSVEWRQPFRTMTFTALDCEMTGLDPQRDETSRSGRSGSATTEWS
jgi:hypothetical protein